VISQTRQRRVALLMGWALGAMLLALAGRLIYIYVVSSEPLTRYAYLQHHMRMPIQPTRGMILDTKFRTLAGTSEVYSVFADPKLVEDAGDAAARLAPILKVNPDEIFRKINDKMDGDTERRFVWLARRLPPEVKQRLKELDLAGIATVSEGKRQYPNGALAAHVIGCVGNEQQGLEGLERSFEDRLCGKEGEAMVLTDSRRRPIWSDPATYVPPVDGQNLVLTLDAVLQSVAEDAVHEAREKYRAKSACAIAMDPQTGAILAMANDPTYEPARYTEFPVDARRNRSLTDTFPPGSAAKPFLVVAALDANVVHYGQVFYCEDGYWADAKLHDAGHHYGNLTLEQILIKSSNIGMAKVGIRLGNTKLYEALVRSGFGKATGLMLPGEADGRVIPLAKWTRLSTTRVPFGQEFTTTPLQLVTAFAGIANGGKMMKPKILRGVLDSRGKVVTDLSEPEPAGQICDPKTARSIIDKALLEVVDEGTGKIARIPGYKVFGKTGTAQSVDPGGGISHSRYFGAFLGGVPADKPAIVCVVVVQEPDPKIGYYGGTVAAPAVKMILEEALQYYGIPPTEPVDEKATARLVHSTVTD